MLDFNARTTFADHLNQRIDAALAGERAAVPARSYLGASRLGVACDRALQFEFTDTPRDAGANLDGRTLRIFEIGHALEEVAIRWLRASGLDLVTRKNDGGQIRVRSLTHARRLHEVLFGNDFSHLSSLEQLGVKPPYDVWEGHPAGLATPPIRPGLPRAPP